MFFRSFYERIRDKICSKKTNGYENNCYNFYANEYKELE